MLGGMFSTPNKKKFVHILLVEDDPIIASTEVKLLKKLGYSVTHVSSGNEAIAKMKSVAPDIDLILMDINLGEGMDGTFAAREILSENDIPIMFLSGITDSNAIERIDDIFSYGFVVKGAEMTILDASIKMALKLHRARRELKENQIELLLLSNAIESSGNAIAIAGTEAVIQYVNPAFLRMWGYTGKDEVIGRPAVDFWDEPEKASFVSQSVLVKGSWSGEMTARNREGESFNVDVNTYLVRDSSDSPIGIIASFSGNIARKLADESVMESEERFRNIFENAIEGIYQTTPDGRYINVNPSFAAMFGYSSPEEMIVGIDNIGTQVYVDPEVREHLKKLLEENNSVKNFKAEVYRKDGSKFWISINAKAMRDKDGNVHHFEGTNIEITEHRILDERYYAELNSKIKSLEIMLNQKVNEIQGKNSRLESLEAELARLKLELHEKENPLIESHNMYRELSCKLVNCIAGLERLCQSAPVEKTGLRVYIESIADSVLSNYMPGENRPGINVYVEQVPTGIKQVVFLGLIVNELLADIFRNSDFPEPPGDVGIEVKKTEGSVILRVTAAGNGFVKEWHEKADAFDLSCVNMIVEQIGGTLETETANGLSVTVKFSH